MPTAPRRPVLLLALAIAFTSLPAHAQVTIATVPVGVKPASAVANTATNQIYVANDCGNDPTCSGSGTITVIDGATLSTQTVQTADHPFPIAINTATNMVYAATCDNDPTCENGTVTVLNGDTLTTRNVNSGVNTNFVAVNSTTNQIYATNLGCLTGHCTVAGTVTVIDGNTLGTRPVIVGYNPVSVAVNPVTNRIYVVNACGLSSACGQGTVTVINGYTFATQTLYVGYRPYLLDLNTSTDMIYVVNQCGNDPNCATDSNGTVTVINGNTLATQTVTVGIRPIPVAVNSATNTIYVANRCGTDPNCVNPPTATIIDGTTLSTTSVTICGVSTYANRVGVDSATNKIYFPCAGQSGSGVNGNSVTVLDGVTGTTTPVAVGDNPGSAVVNSVTNRIYVPTSDNTVSVIGGDTKLQLVNVTPCRVVDTRNTDGPFGGPPIQGGTSRSFAIPQGACNIPTSAAAYSLNVTVVPHGPLEYLTIWPTPQIQPTVSTLNSTDGRVKANAAIVPAGVSGAVSVYATNTTDVILDIDAYFAPATSGNYQFYQLPPCRIVDTRGGQDGGTLQAGVERDYSIPGNCGIPGGATAYSFNVTVLPAAGGLDYLTVWPKGETMPTVSTLNDDTGTVVANAAIVPAGSQNTTAFYAHSNNTDLLLDVNGYFAPPGTGGLSMYPIAPCRVLDTRTVNGGEPFMGVWNAPDGVNVVGSRCAPPSTSQAFIFNATVVPSGQMPYLTLWPHGKDQPLASTLNAYDGFITSNMAIVPTDDGSIDAYAAGLTQLILDIFGYFAP